jgi:hypothetical protein
LPDAEAMCRLINLVHNLMANNMRGIQGFGTGSFQEDEVFQSVRVALRSLGWDLCKAMTPDEELAQAQQLERAHACMEQSIERWGVTPPSNPTVERRKSRTPGEQERLIMLSALFGQLYENLLRWATMLCPDGNVEKLPAQEAATLELFEAAWYSFDGHTRESDALRARLKAAGEHYGFDVHFHLPLDPEETAWLKEHGIANENERRL